MSPRSLTCIQKSAGTSTHRVGTTRADGLAATLIITLRSRHTQPQSVWRLFVIAACPTLRLCRRALEEAFTHYVSQRYADYAMGSLRSSVRARVATCVYSRVISEGGSGSAAETSGGLAGKSSASTEAPDSRQEFAYEPPHSATAIDFINAGGRGPVHKLTAVMSMRHCNAESCW